MIERKLSMLTLPHNWEKFITNVLPPEDYLRLSEKVEALYNSELMIYPPKHVLFKALELCDVDDVKVVILGQDPYHNESQAMGLSFSVPVGQTLPPSLRNIYKELRDDVNLSDALCNATGDLSSWAKQGVLLLNSVLTVQAHQANSHKNLGWQIVTDAIITQLNQRNKPIVFVLWGSASIAKAQLITNPAHRIITSPHPSPLSAYRGFFGSKPFSKCNAFLVRHGEMPIKWESVFKKNE